MWREQAGSNFRVPVNNMVCVFFLLSWTVFGYLGADFFSLSFLSFFFPSFLFSLSSLFLLHVHLVTFRSVSTRMGMARLGWSSCNTTTAFSFRSFLLIRFFRLFCFFWSPTYLLCLWVSLHVQSYRIPQHVPCLLSRKIQRVFKKEKIRYTYKRTSTARAIDKGNNASRGKEKRRNQAWQRVH